MYTNAEIARIINALENTVWAQYWDDRHEDVYDACSDAVKEAAKDAVDLILDLTCEPYVLKLDEIPTADAVWLEIKHTNAYTLAVTAYRSHGERTMSLEHGFYQSLPLYGKQWRCWSKRPTEEQRIKEEWK